MITITYYHHGEQVTEDFTEEEARAELEYEGVKEVWKLTEVEVYELLKEILEEDL